MPIHAAKSSTNVAHIKFKIKSRLNILIIKTFQYRLYFVVGYLKNSLKLALSSYIQQGIITLRPHFIINHLILFVLNEQNFMVFPFEIVQFIGGQ